MKKYFRLLPLSLKLLLIGVIPVIFILYLGFQYYTEKQQRLNALRIGIERIKLNGQVSDIINQLQKERKLSFDKIMRGISSDALILQRIQTDTAIKILSQSEDASITGFIEFTNLKDLSVVRKQTDTLKVKYDIATDFYSSAIFRLNTLTAINVTRTSRLQPIFDDLKSHILLSQLISYLYIIQSNIYNILYTRQYMNEVLAGTYGTYKVFNSYEKEFFMKGAEQTIKEYRQLLQTTELKPAKEYINKLFKTFKVDSTYTADEWWSISEKGIERLKTLELNLWQKIVNETNTIYAIYDKNKQTALITTIIVLLIIISIVFYTSVVISSMLNDLKSKAQKIANGQSEISFQQFSRDEIGDLAKAIQKIDENQRLLSQAADQIGKGNFKTIVSPRSREDMLGNAIVKMQEDLHKFSEKMEALVRQRTVQLESSNADLQQFAHVASHDLKEPLRKIQYFNSRISDVLGNAMPDKGKVYLEKINSAAARLSNLVEGILKYSIVNANESDFEIIFVNDILKNIVTDLELMIQQKNAAVYYECNAKIYGVPLLIQQLFYNLLYNALKFSKQEVAPEINIYCRIERSDNISSIQIEDSVHSMYEITISDNGIGFSEENSKKIFEVFGRLHSRMQYEGTGLGLALCKKIVTLHHGYIVAEGQEGQGAVFKIYLPVTDHASM